MAEDRITDLFKSVGLATPKKYASLPPEVRKFLTEMAAEEGGIVIPEDKKPSLSDFKDVLRQYMDDDGKYTDLGKSQVDAMIQEDIRNRTDELLKESDKAPKSKADQIEKIAEKVAEETDPSIRPDMLRDFVEKDTKEKETKVAAESAAKSAAKSAEEAQKEARKEEAKEKALAKTEAELSRSESELKEDTLAQRAKEPAKADEPAKAEEKPKIDYTDKAIDLFYTTHKTDFDPKSSADKKKLGQMIKKLEKDGGMGEKSKPQFALEYYREFDYV